MGRSSEAQNHGERAQDVADKEVSGPPQGTDHGAPAKGDAANNAAQSSTNEAGSAGNNQRKSSRDEKLVSGDAVSNDPARGTLREDELA